MIKLVVFDLDGTLLDTLDDLAACTNVILGENGYKVHERERYKTFVGNGALKLIERAVDNKELEEKVLIEMKEAFVAYYDEHLLDYVKPYGGIHKLLQDLQSQGVKLAIATNKPHDQAVKLVDYCFGDIEFVEVVGNKVNVPHKPDPFVVNEIMYKVHVTKEEVLYVGDSDVDMQTAANADVKGIGVSWGFRTQEELYNNGAQIVITQAEELLLYVK